MHPPHQPISGRRPGARRKALVQKYHKRGRKPHNIWFHYSPKLDCDVVLTSDAAFDHFCWLEADCTVSTYELEPATVMLLIDGTCVPSSFNVRVQRVGGTPELRDVRSYADGDPSQRVRSAEACEAIHRAGYEYLCFSKAVMQEHHQLISNWCRALAFISAAREHPLNHLFAVLDEVFRHTPTTSIGGLLQNVAGVDHPLYLAALFRHLQAGRLTSDLDRRPLSPSTRLSRGEILA